jgi:transcriptional regulator with XRE-family HTH domain
LSDELSLRATPEADLHDLAIVRGLSQEQLAERAGIHRTYVADIERGQRHVGLVNVARLAAALEVDLPALMAVVESAHNRGACAPRRARTSRVALP